MVTSTDDKQTDTVEAVELVRSFTLPFELAISRRERERERRQPKEGERPQEESLRFVWDDWLTEIDCVWMVCGWCG